MNKISAPIQSVSFGESKLGQPINVLALDGQLNNKKILVLSGLHGDETEGILLNNMILGQAALLAPPFLAQTLFLPVANPDGFSLNQRWTANFVDLNRNWPTKDWSSVISNPRYPPGPTAASECETRVLRDFLEKYNVEIILDLHSYKDAVLIPWLFKKDLYLDDHLRELAEGLKLPLNYDEHCLGYTISGGLHTWCTENQIQHITLEIKKGIGQFEIKEQYLQPMLKFLGQI